ncbi:MAG: ATP synthase F1 subunit delta [Bacteroidia bacterium]|jgi:F-type H+-transporting ATPase subunit delta|nr:ATP synthase F1 subunit delta [Bacteroidia bacterium]
MRESRVSHRYAKSLLDLALEKGQLEQVHEDMRLILTTVQENRELSVMLRSPVIKTDKKQDILKAIFGGKIGVIPTEFVDIITRKRREGELEAIAEAFITQYRRHKQILTAVITTASGLDDKLRAQVLEIVKQSAGGKAVELVEKTDKALMGGFILRVGDNQVDASILRQVRNLERNFSENPYIKEY